MIRNRSVCEPAGGGVVGGLFLSRRRTRGSSLLTWFAIGLSLLLAGCDGRDVRHDGSHDGSESSDSKEAQDLAPNQVWAAEGEDQFGGEGALAELGDRYIARYFSFFPSRATSAGNYEYDRQFESFTAEGLNRWFEFSEQTLSAISDAVSRDCTTVESQVCLQAKVDAELLGRHIKLQLIDWQERDAPSLDPSLWTGVVSRAAVYLLVREDRPSAERLPAITERLRQVPRFLEEAQHLLRGSDPELMATLDCALASSQANSLARFYRTGLIEAGRSQLESMGESERDAALEALTTAASQAADALENFGRFTEDLGERAQGSSILGPELYARRFALYTGLDDTPDAVLADAEAALESQIAEVSNFASRVWTKYFEEEPPVDAKERVRKLFLRLGDDHAQSIDEFVADYRNLVKEAEEFVKTNSVVSVPDPLTLITDRSPEYFSGAAVGGVYAAGPYAPNESTLLYLPTPPASFDKAQQDEFFRDFNHHFNVAITPHELMPGHYLQLKWAALHPSKIRSLFGDSVTIEGWGTFVERLMLDLGWGDDLAFAAHLKKRLENVARTIVDIRVHTKGMNQDDVERFVVEEALQERQFARNMRRRTLTTSPQLVTYYLGSREIEKVYGRWQQRFAVDEEVSVRAFTDAVMTMGPVPLDWWDELFPGGAGAGGEVASD